MDRHVAKKQSDRPANATGKLPGVLVVHDNRGPFGANEQSERGRLNGRWRELRLIDGKIIKQALIDCAPK